MIALQILPKTSSLSAKACSIYEQSRSVKTVFLILPSAGLLVGLHPHPSIFAIYMITNILLCNLPFIPPSLHSLLDCPMLAHISIGNSTQQPQSSLATLRGSLVRCSSFELVNLPSLEGLRIGHGCLLSPKSFSLNNFRSLSTLYLGQCSLSQCSNVHMENLPSLHTIIVNWMTLFNCKKMSCDSNQGMWIHTSAMIQYNGYVHSLILRLEWFCYCLLVGCCDDLHFAIEGSLKLLQLPYLDIHSLPLSMQKTINYGRM